MKVRKAKATDSDLIKKIHKESSREIGSFNLFKSWEKYLSGKSPYAFYVIEGKGFMRYGYSKRMKCNTIKEIGVLKSERGKGVAEKFFDVVKHPMCLTCNTDNDSGNRFYQKMNMKKIGVKKSKNGSHLMNVWVL